MAGWEGRIQLAVAGHQLPLLHPAGPPSYLRRQRLTQHARRCACRPLRPLKLLLRASPLHVMLRTLLVGSRLGLAGGDGVTGATPLRPQRCLLGLPLRRQ